MTHPHTMTLCRDGIIRAVYTTPRGRRYYIRDGRRVYC